MRSKPRRRHSLYLCYIRETCTNLAQIFTVVHHVSNDLRGTVDDDAHKCEIARDAVDIRVWPVRQKKRMKNEKQKQSLKTHSESLPYF